jgi:hypothetical protein
VPIEEEEVEFLTSYCNTDNVFRAQALAVLQVPHSILQLTYFQYILIHLIPVRTDDSMNGRKGRIWTWKVMKIVDVYI